MLGYDPDSERHQLNEDVHYRLYRLPDGTPGVICVQGFDYHDYVSDRLLSNKAYLSETAAAEGLRLLLADAAILLGLFPGTAGL